MRRTAAALAALSCLLLFAACGAEPVKPGQTTRSTITETAKTEAAAVPEETENTMTETAKTKAAAVPEETENTMTLTLNKQAVPVQWEANESTAALRRQAAQGAITVALTPYGGFEQVGSLGRSYPSNDTRTTTKSGDIMLYASDQIVLFYGENTWAYTRLGKIDLPDDEVTRLLTQDNITLTLSAE